MSDDGSIASHAAKLKHKLNEIEDSIKKVELFGTSRRMTDGEIKMASEIFKSSIDYSIVFIEKNTPFAKVMSNSAPATTPNGSIKLTAKKYYEDDYSTSKNIYNKALFIHEISHVWQYHVSGNNSLVPRFLTDQIRKLACGCAPGLPQEELYEANNQELASRILEKLLKLAPSNRDVANSANLANAGWKKRAKEIELEIMRDVNKTKQIEYIYPINGSRKFEDLFMEQQASAIEGYYLLQKHPNAIETTKHLRSCVAGYVGDTVSRTNYLRMHSELLSDFLNNPNGALYAREIFST